MDRITARPTSFEGLKVEMPRSFKVNVSQGFGNPKAVFGGFGQYPEPLELSLTGTFMCSDCESVSDQFNRLLSMAGKPHIDVIGYLPNDCCCTGSSCGKCGDCQGDRPVTWLTTTGTIESVERGYEVSGDTQYPGSMMSVSFKMILDAYWYPMNSYVWYPQYGAEPYDSFRQDADLVKGILPTHVDERSRFYFWKRNYVNENLLYDPLNWSEMYRYDDAVYSPGFIPNVSAEFRYRVRVPRTRWAASPTSLYAFRNLPTDGEIRITVNSEIAPFQTQSFESTIDIVSLFTEAFVIGIDTSEFYPTQYDSLIVDDGLYHPGFVFKDSLKSFMQIPNDDWTDSLRTLVPLWTYDTRAPGELLGVDNYVTIETPPEVEIAYLHTFRGL